MRAPNMAVHFRLDFGCLRVKPKLYCRKGPGALLWFGYHLASYAKKGFLLLEDRSYFRHTDGDAPGVPSLSELEELHRVLSAQEREELLECLLIAASRGPDSMLNALTPWLVAAAGRELLNDAGE